MAKDKSLWQKLTPFLDKYSEKEIKNIREKEGVPSKGKVKNVTLLKKRSMKKKCISKGGTWKGGKIAECIPKSQVRKGKGKKRDWYPEKK